jgi:hypothetical protein
MGRLLRQPACCSEGGMAEQAQESPESRLLGAGFSRQLEYWRTPDGSRVLNLNDAIAALDAGEIKPYRLSWPGTHPDIVAGFQPRSEEEIDRMLGRNQPPPEEPPPLPSWAEPWAELIAAQLKPIIRAEVRSALRAEARRQARETT